MSVLDDLGKLADCGDPRGVPESESLLSKYDIPIDHFEFQYIEKCNNGKELERILQVLKSGQEGYYPDLLKCTENRLRLIKPKSRYLRQSCPVLDKKALKQEEAEELTDDINNFVKDAIKKDKELESRKTKNQYCDIEVRKFVKELTEDQTKNNKKRISSTDYKSWDKYDPDTELLKMDLEEEKTIKEALKQDGEKKQKPKLKKTVTFNQFATEAEAIFYSEREREKGNEFFKAGEFQEALQSYTNSIQSKTTVNNLNNRAVTYLKLKKYEQALGDCNKVLTLDKDNLKANIRKSEALDKLERFEEALETIEFVIQGDPNNSVAQDMANKIRKKCCKEVQNTTRMKIIEIE